MSVNRPLPLVLPIVVLGAMVGLVMTAPELALLPQRGDVLFFLALGLLTELMRVPTARKGFISAGLASHFAATLILGGTGAAWVAALTRIAGGLIRRERPVLLAYHVGLVVVACLLTSTVMAGDPTRWDLASLGGFAGVAVAAATFAAVLIGGEVLFVSADRGVSPGAAWRAHHRWLVSLIPTLLGLGLLLAHGYRWRQQIFGDVGLVFAAVAVLVPLAVLFYASRLRFEMERLYARCLRALGRAMESKFPNPLGHCERVARLSVGVAERLGLAPDEVQTIEYAAYLHDVGMMSIPRRVLRGSEFREADPELAHHAARGAEILEPLGSRLPVIPLLEAHHKPYNADPQPPLGARILSAASDFDEYVHREGLVPEAALLRLRAEAGGYYDPAVVRALSDTLRSSRREPRGG